MLTQRASPSDLGWGDTGHQGAEYPTPTIDKLALGGIRLNQSYVTQLCSPTRASLLTVRFLTEIVDDFRRFVDEIWRF